MSWKLPPRRFPYGSIGESVDRLGAALDWAYEQLSRIFVGVPLVNQRGQVTISGANTSATATFAEEEEDLAYSVFLTSVAFTGTPAAGAFTIKSVVKATDGITPEVIEAPGSGNSVIFDYIAARELRRQ